MTDPIEVLITMPFPENLVNRLSEVSPRLKFTVVKANKPEDISAETWARVEILYTARVLPTPELVPNLRWIQFHWAGVDHILNEPLLRKPELIATTLSGAAASQVAEYIVMMLLALGHHMPELVAYQKRAEWPRDRWERFIPVELRGSAVGIVGYGSIGRQLARLLAGFGATVLAAKRDAMHPEDFDYVPEGMGDPGGDYVHRLYPAEALRSMLKDCDFVVVCVPKSPGTLNLIKTEELAAMKPSAYLVDISRGGIVDHNALVSALKDRKIAGVALDVFPEEPLPADSPLWKLPNVLITPHISGITSQYDERAVEMFSANLTRYLSGLPLYNRIDSERGY
jgi:phosphoglycerate dehydrogenase-like enzyme